MKIAIIGSGNVAFHLVKMMKDLPTVVLELYSRNEVSGKAIAQSFQINFNSSLQGVVQDKDVIIVAVSDDALGSVFQNVAIDKHTIVTHTSGLKSIEVFKNFTSNFGSFYPLQTFTKEREVDYKTVPFLIAANQEKSKEVLFHLASKISQNVQYVSDEKRSQLHLPAVMVNNFSNHLFALAKQHCEENDLDFELLKPLMLETVNKAIAQNPSDIQTGPAVRNDEKTIAKHLAWIKDEKLKNLYRIFTESIQGE